MKDESWFDFIKFFVMLGVTVFVLIQISRSCNNPRGYSVESDKTEIEMKYAVPR